MENFGLVLAGMIIGFVAGMATMALAIWAAVGPIA